MAVDPGVSAQIRAGALQVLKSPVEPARRSAAQAVAVMGAIEVERGTWPEFLATLLVNATGTELQDDIKVATLEAIGYFCEIVDRAAVNQDLTNNLLTAIVESMKPARSKALKLAATSAMLNTLGFAEGTLAARSSAIKSCSASARRRRRTFLRFAGAPTSASCGGVPLL